MWLVERPLHRGLAFSNRRGTARILREGGTLHEERLHDVIGTRELDDARDVDVLWPRDTRRKGPPRALSALASNMRRDDRQ